MSNRKPVEIHDDTPLVRHVADLEEDAALDIVRRRLEEGDDPLAIIYECDRGMRIIGRRYQEGEYYIAALIMAGEIFRQVVELVKPRLKVEVTEEPTGTVLLGTVEGDIHDIGKDVLAMLAACHGFVVHDLGVDVRPSRFVEATVKHKPDIVGLSGLLTSAYYSMQETVAALRDATEDWDTRPILVIGGGRIDEDVCRYVGADYWTLDAMEGVELFLRLMKEDDDEGGGG